jgi:tetratricopeptide (TPR) repeat protein
MAEEEERTVTQADSVGKNSPVTPVPGLQQSQQGKKVGKRGWVACILIPIILVCGLVSLVGVYFLGGYLMTTQADAAYQAGNCEKVVSLVDLIQKLYPLNIAPYVEPGLKQGDECRVYVNASFKEKQKSWEDAYSGYLTYTKKYPNGVVKTKAIEGIARSLLGWGQSYLDEKRYGDAIGKLNALIKDYADTAAAMDAQPILPQAHLGWAKELEGKGSYSKAAEEYDNAIDTDLSQAPDGPAAQARAAFPGLQLKWADELISQGEYSSAVSHYQTAAQSSPPTDLATINDKMANAYVKWAYALGSADKFFEALSKTGLAKEKASGTSTQDNVKRANVTILKDFSDSSSSDAQMAMQQLADSICRRKAKVDPSYPIFAMDEINRKVFPSGIDNINTSMGVFAQRPSAMYYAACIESDSRVMQTCPYNGGYYIKRVQYFWTVNVYDIPNGRKYRTTTLYGSPPQTCSYSEWFTTGVYTKFYYGDTPTSADLAKWLAGFIK